MPSGLSIGKGKGQSEDAASKCTMEPASKRARVSDAQAQCSPSTVISESGFAPLTPSRSDTGSSEYSPVSDAEQESQGVTSSSECSPDSDAEPEEQKVKTEAQTEDLLLAQAAQALTSRQSTT